VLRQVEATNRASMDRCRVFPLCSFAPVLPLGGLVRHLGPRPPTLAPKVEAFSCALEKDGKRRRT